MIIDILIALGVVGAVGLLAAILLALFSHLFGIEQDEREKSLRECLPGINCGACGYKGCDDYAAAMNKGKAGPSLCVPGAKDTAKELADILGVEAEAPKDVVAFVHCNGTCEKTTKKMIYDGIQTCRAASAIYGGPNSCNYGCMGLGDCAAACPANAICVDDGIARVNSSLCLGCGLCVSTCPKNIISLVPQDTNSVVMCSSKDKGAVARKLCSNACIGCKKCEKTCPEGAIKVINDLATIDYDKCSRCGACADVCPTEALKKVFLPDLIKE